MNYTEPQADGHDEATGYPEQQQPDNTVEQDHLPVETVEVSATRKATDLRAALQSTQFQTLHDLEDFLNFRYNMAVFMTPKPRANKEYLDKLDNTRHLEIVVGENSYLIDFYDRVALLCQIYTEEVQHADGAPTLVRYV